MSLLTVASLLLFTVSTASAVSIPIRRDVARRSTSIPFKSQSSAHDFNSTDEFHFTNEGDVFYAGTIVVDGQSYVVDLDTGSTDLWIDTSGVKFSSSVTNTSINVGIFYADGTVAQGPVLVANVSFGDFTVPQQAFVSAPGSNATTYPDKGLMGIGPPSASGIVSTLSDAGSSVNGNSFLDNVFSLYSSEEQFISFLLSRTQYGQTDGGIFTIGEYAQNFSTAGALPKVAVVDNESWSVGLDAIVINGNIFSGLPDQATSLPDGVLLALLDTGTELLSAPSYYVDALYKNVSGSKFDSDGQRYYVPCDTKINVTIALGPAEIPIDPIDTVIFDHFGDDGEAVCAGSWSYIDGPAFILGDTFLRNAYTVMHFGNFTSTGQGIPFVQLWGTTDPDEAYANYDQINAARIAYANSTQNGNSSNGSTTQDDSVRGALQATPSAASTPSSASSSTVDLSGLTRNTYIIIGLLAGAIVLLLAILVRMLTSNNARYKALPTQR